MRHNSLSILAAAVAVLMAVCCVKPEGPEPGPGPGPGPGQDDPVVPVDPTDTSGTITPVDPEYPGIEYKLNDGTAFMDKATTDYLVAYEPRNWTMYISKSCPENLLPKEWVHYIINTPCEMFPDGAIIYFQTREDAGDNWKYIAAKDGLNSVFIDLNVEETELDLASNITRIEDADGKPIQFKTKATGSGKVRIDLPQVPWPVGGDIEFTPKMSMDMVLKMQLRMDSYRVSTMNFVIDADVSLGGTAEIGIETGFFGYSPRLFTIYCAAIPVGPLLITPAIDVFAFIDVNGKVSFELNVTYTQHVRSSLHYDEVNYLSGYSQLTDPEDGAFKMSIGPKIAGSVTYGLSVGPRIGIYGEVVSLGIYLNTGLKHTVSELFDLAKGVPPMESLQSWGDLLQNADLATDISVSGSVSMSGMGFPLTYTTPDVTLPVSTKKLIPTICKSYEAKANGTKMTFKTWVKNEALFYPDLKMSLGKIGEEDEIIVDFDFDDSKIAQLENGADSVMITASADILENVVYQVTVLGELAGATVQLRRFATNLESTDEAAEWVMKQILADLTDSRSGNWDGCNWLNEDTPISSMANVTKFAAEDGRLSFSIVIPERWATTDNIFVDNYSQGMKDFSWNLEIKGTRSFNTVDIEEACCAGIAAGNDIQRYIYHSTLPGLGAPWIPEKAKYVDFSGTQMTQAWIGNFARKATPTTLIMDGCTKLEGIEIGGQNLDRVTAPATISAKNCPALNYVSINNANVTDAMVNSLSMTGTFQMYNCNGLKDVVLKGCGALSLQDTDMNSLSVMGLSGLKDAQILSGDIGTVAISNCPALTRAYVNYLSNVETLSVTDCAALTKLVANQCGLSSFTASGLPVIQDLDCRNNTSLTGTMLPVFDQMFNAGRTPQYDQRFRYSGSGGGSVGVGGTEGGFEYEDLGYGYYYPGEPDRGYHRR